MAVGYGQDQDGAFRFAINHQEWKTGEPNLAGTARKVRPAMRCFEDSVDCLVEFSDKFRRGQRAALTVPVRRCQCFFDSGGMKGE